MLRKEVDWRHWLAAALLVGLLLAAGWRMWTGPSPRPTAEAPRGPHARTSDAPEGPFPSR